MGNLLSVRSYRSIRSCFVSILAFMLITLPMNGCGGGPRRGPDKTVAGAVLGAAWGAGAGAVVGNQVSSSGEGAAVGSGFGLVAGAASGLGYDSVESDMADQEETLASLKIQNAANREELMQIQHRLDSALGTDLGVAFYQVFFDQDATSLKTGSIANLEVIAEAIKTNPHVGSVNVVGHSDDAGTPDYNERLAEARARSVSAYLAARGISVDQIKISSFGSQRPIASNTTAVGRQLNRRVDIYLSK